MTIPLRVHVLLSVLVGLPLAWEISRVDISFRAAVFVVCCLAAAAAPWVALRVRWWAGVPLAMAGVLGSAALVLVTNQLTVRPEVANLPLVQLAGLLVVLVIVLRDAGPWGAALGVSALTLSAAAAAVTIQLWARAAHLVSPPYPPTVAGTAFLAFGGAAALGVFLRSGYSAASRWTTGSTSEANIERR